MSLATQNAELTLTVDVGGELLAIDDLSVDYTGPSGTHQAVRNVSFSVARGECVALVGESGSGKTSLAMAIAGFLRISDGAHVNAKRMDLDGRPIGHVNVSSLPRRTPGISMIFQDAMTSLDPVARISTQFLDVLRHIHKCSRREGLELAKEWLDRVGLVETQRILKSRPWELSGGMQQRIMLAIALCGKPGLVIADEPTSALDATHSRSAMQLLVEMTAKVGAALLIISHDLALSMEFTDRVMVMQNGVIVEQGTPPQLGRPDSHPYTKGLLACIPTLESAEMEWLPTMHGRERIGPA